MRNYNLKFKGEAVWWTLPKEEWKKPMFIKFESYPSYLWAFLQIQTKKHFLKMYKNHYKKINYQIFWKSHVSKTLHFILLSTNPPEKRSYLHLATEKISFTSLCHTETEQSMHLAWCIKCWFAVTSHGEMLNMWALILPAKSWAQPSLTSGGVTLLRLDTQLNPYIILL